MIIFSYAWSDGQWSCSMHARPLIWSQSWFKSYTLVSPIYRLFFCILIYDFIFKQLVQSLSAMHGEKISGAVACMHGRCFNLKAGSDLLFINFIIINFFYIFYFFIFFLSLFFFTFFLEHHITGGKYAQKTRTNIFRYLLMIVLFLYKLTCSNIT